MLVKLEINLGKDNFPSLFSIMTRNCKTTLFVWVTHFGEAWLGIVFPILAKNCWKQNELICTIHRLMEILAQNSFFPILTKNCQKQNDLICMGHRHGGNLGSESCFLVEQQWKWEVTHQSPNLLNLSLNCLNSLTTVYVIDTKQTQGNFKFIVKT